MLTDNVICFPAVCPLAIQYPFTFIHLTDESDLQIKYNPSHSVCRGLTGSPARSA